MKSLPLLSLLCAVTCSSCQNFQLPWKKADPVAAADPYATGQYQPYPGAAPGYGQQSYPQQPAAGAQNYNPYGEQAQVYPAGGAAQQPTQAQPEWSNAPAPAATGGGGTSYVVRKGDTLSKISRNNSTSVNALMQANGLNSDLIRVGQTLRIP